jgi:hypothetical protein
MRHKKKFKKLTTNPSADLTDRKLGGTMSGVKVGGGSTPFRHRATNHIAKANCSLFSFPLCLISHRALQTSIKIYEPRLRVGFTKYEPEHAEVRPTGEKHF